MKNLNFALISALYASFVMWIFTTTRSFESLLVYGIAASPALIIAMRLQGKTLVQKRYDESTKYPWLSLLLALSSSISMVVFIMKFMKKSDMVQFFGGYILGWTVDEAMIMLFLSIAMAASGVVIWTTYRFRSSKSPFIRYEAPYVFFAGAPEKLRLGIYIYAFAFLWCAAVAGQAAIWNGCNIDSVMVIRYSRAAIPMTIMLVVALMRVPLMGIAAIVSAVGAWYVVSQNYDFSRAVVFVGCALVISAAYIVVSSILTSASIKKETATSNNAAAPDAEPKNISDAQSESEAKEDGEGEIS